MKVYIVFRNKTTDSGDVTMVQGVYDTQRKADLAKDKAEVDNMDSETWFDTDDFEVE